MDGLADGRARSGAGAFACDRAGPRCGGAARASPGIGQGGPGVFPDGKAAEQTGKWTYDRLQLANAAARGFR